MKKLILPLLILLTACTMPKSPAQDVYALESSYAGALKIELAYSKLPRCIPSGPTLCSTKAAIKAAQSADDKAWVAIQAAQEAVRTPGFTDGKITAAIASAKALVASYVGITKQLRVK